MNRIILLLIAFANSGYAHQQLVLSGRVADKGTGKALENASITLKNRAIATIANEAGDFTFYIPDFYKHDTLTVSVLGYEPYETPLKSLNFNTTLEIRLNVLPYSLQEIVISEELSPDDIFGLCLKNIKQNYFTSLYKSRAFYRETQQVEQKYVSLIEAAIDIYNEGYAKQGKQKIKIHQLRKSKSHVHTVDEFWDTQNLMLGILEQDFMSFHNMSMVRSYTLERESNTSLNGKPVFVLSSKTPKYWPVRFYIQCDNYALVRLEKLHDVKYDPEKPWKVAGNDTVDVRTIKRSLQVDYTSYRGKYYMSAVRFSSTMIHEGTHTKKKLMDFTIRQDLLVNEVEVSGVVPLKKDEAIQMGKSLEHQAFDYDPAFWKNYNIIRATPLQEKVRKDLETETTLEEQFKKSESPQEKTSKRMH